MTFISLYMCSSIREMSLAERLAVTFEVNPSAVPISTCQCTACVFPYWLTAAPCCRQWWVWQAGSCQAGRPIQAEAHRDIQPKGSCSTQCGICLPPHRLMPITCSLPCIAMMASPVLSINTLCILGHRAARRVSSIALMCLNDLVCRQQAADVSLL